MFDRPLEDLNKLLVFFDKLYLKYSKIGYYLTKLLYTFGAMQK